MMTPAEPATPVTPLQAARALAIAHRVRFDELVVLKDGSNLLVHLAPAPVVLRVATFTARIRREPLPWLQREADLVSWLAAAGAAVMKPSEIIPVGPHQIGAWAMSAWRFVEHRNGVVPDGRSTLAALDELHQALRGYRGELPLLNPAADDLDRAIAFAVAEGLFNPGQAEDLRNRRDAAFAEVVAAAPDRQALHGDAFPRNSLMTKRGIVWIDFEDCCWGPVIWDHATLLRRIEGEPAADAIRRRHPPDALAAAVELRGLQADVWTVLHDARASGRWPESGS
ncbi:MAG TPA: phosphotransferase [Candidatus Limnocylindrales bacterium]|nr:phosphotransferase [Candidatus Limnocylindrales bacterium]